jgi:transposase-like protein
MYVKRRFHQIAVEDENIIKTKIESKAILEQIAIKNLENTANLDIKTLRLAQNYQGISKKYLNNMLKNLNFQENVDEIESCITF